MKIRFFLIVLFLPVIMGFREGQGQPEKWKSVFTDKDIPGNYLIRLEPETRQLIRNPLMGWGIYSDAYHPDMGFWSKFDHISLGNGGALVKASDYATHLYIRWPWSAFERDEGEFAWDYDPFFKLLEEGARARGLKLAFRIYVDSRDYNTSSTPRYVQEAGASGYVGNTGKWSPFPDDPIFQEKYAKFIKVFAERYDNTEVTDFVDGFGLGKWGEGHSMILEKPEDYAPTFKWITDLYLDNFKRVPLAINYHVEIGRALLDDVIGRGYVLRHDAFGMTEYYGEFEKLMVSSHFPARPVIAESGWWQNGSIAWQQDPHQFKDWRDVWKKTFDDALSERANILDLRNISETRSWFLTAPDLVQRFVEIGGYRLYPDLLSVPKTMHRNRSFKIKHRWRNLGVGVCPNNIKPWDYKYKVAFALLDKKTGEVKAKLIDSKADPAQWLHGKDYTYVLETQINDLAKGDYTLALAIINTQCKEDKGINMAVRKKVDANGWLPLSKVAVR